MKMATPAPSSLINQLNEFCTQSRTRIESRHRFGINGAEILQEYTHLADNVIQRIYQCATAEGLIGNDTPAAVLALGGYGRCELNPYSDIDIMLVYDGSSVTIKQLQSFANQLISVLWDVGFEVGHSCRSINDCIQATYQDVFSKTSMIEARYIVGAKTVYQEFRRQTSKHFYKRKVNRFITTTIQEWKQRHETYGSTIYLQEPNIKESVGGLRDFHTAIWVAAVRYGIKELDTLAKRKIVPQAIAEACEASLDYLWRLRNELHYVTRRRADSLTFEVQQTIATNLGYTDGENVLAEEQMMRDYYLHAETLFEFASLIIDRVLSIQFRSILFDGLDNMRADVGIHQFPRTGVPRTGRISRHLRRLSIRHLAVHTYQGLHKFSLPSSEFFVHQRGHIFPASHVFLLYHLLAPLILLKST